jgi:hypothetical protein
MKIITVQPSAVTDHITGDGHELQQLPYPFHIREDGQLDGSFWATQADAAVGFQAKLGVPTIDLWWRDAVAEPERAVGMYLVTRKGEHWATWEIAIQAAHVTEVRDDLWVVVAPHYWGKGATEDAAKRQLKREGGRLDGGYTVFRFDYRSQFESVHPVHGSVSWTGDRPQIREVKARKRAKQ